MKFDPTKPVQTRDGRAAIILSTKGKYIYRGSAQPIVAQINQNGQWNTMNFTLDGHFYTDTESQTDLINIPVKHKLTGFLNVYPHKNPETTYHPTREIANSFRDTDCIACLNLANYNIEFTEGEGL